MEDISCVILAAGEGTRMKLNSPKVLSSVLFEPMVGWVINSVASCSISKICIVVGYQHDLVKDYLKNLEAHCETAYQKERRGTAHAVLAAEEFLNKNIEGDILILGGDSPFIDRATIKKAYKMHNNAKNDATIISAKVDNPSGYGRIIRNSVDYNLRAIVEERDANFDQKAIREINSGAYWFKTKRLLEFLKKTPDKNSQNEYYLTSTVELMINAGLRVDAFESSSSNVALGANNLDQLQQLNEIARNKVIDSLLCQGVKIPCRDGVIISNRVKIGTDTTILPGTILAGNTKIGKNCTIGPNSQIIDSQIGNNCIINYSYCKNCVIKEGRETGPFEKIID